MRSVVLALGLSVTAAIGIAQAQQPAASLHLELNAAQPTEKGCRFTFLVVNKMGKSLAKAAFEMALFDDKGVVDRLTVLEFKDLADGKTKVSRFELPGANCAALSRVLVNATTACEGEGISPSICDAALSTSAKGRIQFGR